MLAHNQYRAARDRFIDYADNAYERLAATDDYQRNASSSKVIQVAVVTVSAAATGVVNSFAHVARLGWTLAIVLAVAVTSFVEGFYFTLRHGLVAVYKSGRQRLYASLCYRAIQATMILNAALMCAYIVGFDVPPWLNLWNHWSIVCHFALALFGVSLVRDSDAVVANRMLELRAETSRQDLITARKVAAIGSPLVLAFAWLRGFFDSVSIAFRLLFRSGGFPKSYLEQVDVIARSQFSHMDDITAPHGRQFPAPAASVTTLPKGPAQRP